MIILFVARPSLGHTCYQRSSIFPPFTLELFHHAPGVSFSAVRFLGPGTTLFNPIVLLLRLPDSYSPSS